MTCEWSVKETAGPGWRGRQGLTRVAFILGVWTMVGLFFASQIYFWFAATERPMSFATSLAWQLAAVYIFAATTPLILWLACHYRIGRYNWRKSVAVHAVAGLVISAAWAAAHVTLDQWFVDRLGALTPARLARMSFYQLDKELLVYWTVVLISHAVNYYHRAREGELRASQAQLQALKMQLHPHFLFNSLHSISSLVHTDPEAADRMIARLGDFLRLTLDASATQEVTLRRELEFLDCYLGIERIRFRDRLTTRVEADPHALNCRVPNLLLQPLVENAIRHGVSARREPGRIEISAARAGGFLRLQVRDNGPGLAAAQAPHVTNGSGGGLGLGNTRARLAQLYGDAHRFEMSDDPRGGAVVTIEIPFTGAAAEPARAPQVALGGDHYAPLLGK
jgi:two-component system, LytTR family, sensor kinase